MIAYMTANDVARETGFAMHGWGHGDRLTNDAFAPLETFEHRFDSLLRRVRDIGFEALDLWGAHLSPDWATDDHVAIATAKLREHGLRVTTYGAWVGPANVRRACELALALGTNVIGAGFSGDAALLVPVLRAHGVTLAVENHPERAPADVFAKIEAGEGTMAATVDTGWWGTQGYDAARAIEELGPHVRHVHLKDVLREGEPHDTCAWGEGIVDVEACVRAVQRIGYAGSFTIEHEPEDHDPSEEIERMLQTLKGWLA